MTAVAKLKPDMELPADPLAKLREPFPAHQISKLPKQGKAQKEALDKDRSLGVNCQVCGGWHHKNAVHLDYVGHAALTDRLLDADPMWAWEPVAFAQDGLPAFDRNGGLWIKLTICGVSRLGYGNAEGKSGGDAVKEIIGDALRNAAMRFGAALDLWHKGDLHVEEEPETVTAEQKAINHLRACAVDSATFKEAWESNKDVWKKLLDAPAYLRVVAVMKELAGKFKAPEPPQREPGDDSFGLGDDEIPNF